MTIDAPTGGSGERAIWSRDITAGIPEQLRQQVVAPGGTRYGLIVAIGEYQNDDPVKQNLKLPFAVADGLAMQKAMTDPACGMFPEANVKLLFNKEATRRQILMELNHLRRIVNEADTVWICFVGHKAEEDGKWFLVPFEGDVNHLQATGLRNQEFEEIVNDFKAQRVLTFWDCCFAMATERQGRPYSFRDANKPDPRSVFANFAGQGRLALAASDGSQRSLELEELGHGLFTHFVIEALRGAADANNDGVVTLDEFWPFVQRNVDAMARKHGHHQTPCKAGTVTDDSQLALTLNRRRAEVHLRVGTAIRQRLGFGANDLTPAEAGLCLRILQYGPTTDAEQDIQAAFEDLADERVAFGLFKAAVKLANAGRQDPSVIQAHEDGERFKSEAARELLRLEDLRAQAGEAKLKLASMVEERDNIAQRQREAQESQLAAAAAKAAAEKLLNKAQNERGVVKREREQLQKEVAAAKALEKLLNDRAKELGGREIQLGKREADAGKSRGHKASTASALLAVFLALVGGFGACYVAVAYRWLGAPQEANREIGIEGTNRLQATQAADLELRLSQALKALAAANQDKDSLHKELLRLKVMKEETEHKVQELVAKISVLSQDVTKASFLLSNRVPVNSGYSNELARPASGLKSSYERKNFATKEALDLQNYLREQATGKINSAFSSNNYTNSDGAHGIAIFVDFTVKGMKGVEGLLRCYVGNAFKDKLPAINMATRDSEGNYCVSTLFKPTLHECNFGTNHLALFVPYSAPEMRALSAEKKKFAVVVNLYTGDETLGQKVRLLDSIDLTSNGLFEWQ